METAEVKQKGRVRHCYPRNEVYHRWIHSPQYVHTPKQGIRCAGCGDYLKLVDFYSEKTNEDIKDFWCLYKDSIIAIIDRNNKKIIINNLYNDHRWRIANALPDDYEIFYTNEIINNPDILHNEEELCKTYAKYLVKQIINLFNEQYFCLADKNKLVHKSFDYTKHVEYENLEKLVSKYKLKKYVWYKESLDEYTITEYNKIRKSIKINLPSIKAILTNRIFTKKEQLKIDQHIFYTEHCFGNGVTLKWIKEHWNQVPTRDEAVKYFENKTEFRNQNQWIKEDNKLTWQELIEHNSEILNKWIKNERDRLQNISDENYNKAIEEFKQLSSQSYTVNDWREGKSIPNKEIHYRRFDVNHRKGQIGKWKDAIITTYNQLHNYFPNTQLRLRDKNIITSRGASVPLDDAIKKFKFIQKFMNESTKQHGSSFTNVNVGIYNLRFIKFKDKVTNIGEYLGYKEWLIQIGCHSLWLDDILDFIHYYKLEKEFGLINNNKPKLNIKIQ